MNTSKPNPQNGSKSSNAMREAAKAKVSAMRRFFVGEQMTANVTHEALGLETFKAVTARGIHLVGFSGRRAKPDFNYIFRTEERAAQYEKDWFDGLVKRAEEKATKKQEAEQHTLKVGDVLSASWGYDQTNYNYYQVTRLVGSRSVEIRELCKEATYDGQAMGGDCVPVKDKFKTEPQVKRVTSDNSVKVFSWGVYARKKESIKAGGMEIFKPDYYTSYA